MPRPQRLAAAALAASVLATAVAQPAAQRDAQRTLNAVELRVPGQPVQRLYGESHALVIGASEYRAGWGRLPGVERDVHAVSRLLRDHGFAVTEVANPTRDQLDAALRAFAAGPGRHPDNRLLVYFAGHGHTLTTAAGSRLGYLVPVDAPRPDRDPGGFRLQAYSMESIEVIARQMEARHVLFLFDSCFSGTIFRSRSGVPDSITDKTSRPVRQFITAGDADQPVPDESIFRRQLEAALRDRAADMNTDGYVTGTELGVFLEDTVTNYSRRTQTPRWGKIRDPDLDKGDFVFALSSPPQPPAQPPAQATPPSGPPAGELAKPSTDVTSLLRLPTPAPPSNSPRPDTPPNDCPDCPKPADSPLPAPALDAAAPMLLAVAQAATAPPPAPAGAACDYRHQLRFADQSTACMTDFPPLWRPRGLPGDWVPSHGFYSVAISTGPAACSGRIGVAFNVSSGFHVYQAQRDKEALLKCRSALRALDATQAAQCSCEVLIRDGAVSVGRAALAERLNRRTAP